MSDEDSFLAVIAHGLISSASAVHGTVVTARAGVREGLSPESVDALLRLAELRSARLVEDLRRLAQALPAGDPRLW